MIGAILKELGAMFFGAPRLAAALLVLIGAAALLARDGRPRLAGVLLVGGCIALLVENVLHAARR
jgi:hypothetical protein